jgi:hypothetical protein
MAWVLGPGNGTGVPVVPAKREPDVPLESMVHPVNGSDRCGGVRLGTWLHRRPGSIRMAHWRRGVDARSCTTMFTGAPHLTPRFGSLVGGTLLGAVLVTTGLTTAYLTIATPFASNLAGGWGGQHGVSIGLGVWSFALIAGGGLLVSGTNQLAATVAFLRRGSANGGPAARALASWSDEVAVVGDVVPNDGAPIPELVIGAFGVAVVHVLPSSKRVRHGPAGWECRTGDTWRPMDDPLDRAMRDADGVRRWLGTADLDFVVRVYAALVVDDRSLARSPTCAVISTQQIPAWIASLPRQRTLTAGRRERLMVLARTPSSAASRGRRQGW